MSNFYMLIVLSSLPMFAQAQQLQKTPVEVARQVKQEMPMSLPVCADLLMSANEKKNCYQREIAKKITYKKSLRSSQISETALTNPTDRTYEITKRFGIKPGIDKLNQRFLAEMYECERTPANDCTRLTARYEREVLALYKDDFEVQNLKEAYESIDEETQNSLTKSTEPYAIQKCTQAEITEAIKDAERRARAEGIIETIRDEAPRILAEVARIDSGKGAPKIERTEKSHSEQYKKMRVVVDRKIETALQQVRDNSATSEIAVQQTKKWVGELKACGATSGACHSD